MTRGLFGKITVGLVATSLLGASTAFAAQPAQIAAINPMVALSLFASSQSRAALCGTAVATAAGAAAVQAAPAPGCVLPAVDAPVAAVPEAAPPALAARPSPFISPLLLGLGAIALGLGLWALSHGGNNDSNPPISPS